MKTVYRRMANTPLNFIITYFQYNFKMLWIIIAILLWMLVKIGSWRGCSFALWQAHSSASVLQHALLSERTCSGLLLVEELSENFLNSPLILLAFLHQQLLHWCHLQNICFVTNSPKSICSVFLSLGSVVLIQRLHILSY